MSKETYDRFQRWIAVIAPAGYAFATGVALTNHDAFMCGLFLALTIFTLGLAIKAVDRKEDT